MTDDADFAASADPAFQVSEDPEMNEALKAGLRQAGYHVMRAGYELLAGVSAFLEAVGGGDDDDGKKDDERPATQRIEVE
jgi:hypothetical protein